MSEQNLANEIVDLRNALNLIEWEVDRRGVPSEALEEVSRAVDSIRKSAWVVLTARHADEYKEFMGRFRIRRAVEICGQLCGDIEGGVITPNTPDLSSLLATLNELRSALAISALAARVQ